MDFILVFRHDDDDEAVAIVEPNEIVHISTSHGAVVDEIKRRGKPYGQSAQDMLQNSSRYGLIPVPEEEVEEMYVLD